MTVRNAASMGTYGAAWATGGYCGSGNVASLIGTLAGRVAIVAGGAHTVFDDLEVALEKHSDAVVFAVNDVGMFLPKLDHWVSLHHDKLAVWKQVRWLTTRHREDTKYHSVDANPAIDYVWEGLTPLFTLSGYFAMQIAHVMGASRIVLCGCPGAPERRFFEAAKRSDFGYGGGDDSHGVREQIEKEMARLPDFKHKVRSTSGWTKTFFGAL